MLILSFERNYSFELHSNEQLIGKISNQSNLKTRTFRILLTFDQKSESENKCELFMAQSNYSRNSFVQILFRSFYCIEIHFLRKENGIFVKSK